MRHDVIQVRCNGCGQPLTLGLTGGPTFDSHKDRRGSPRFCRVVLLPDPGTQLVGQRRLDPGEDPVRVLREARARWLKRNDGRWLDRNRHVDVA